MPVNKAGWFVGEVYLTIQLLTQRPHHPGAKAAPGRNNDWGTSALDPNEMKPFFSFVNRPRDFYAAGRNRERAKFRCVSTKLVKRHCQRDDGAGSNSDIRPIEVEPPCLLA